MKYTFLLAMIVCLFSSCLEKFDANQLNNTHWVLKELKGTTLPTESKATLNFAEGLKVSGKSFCNNYGGIATVTDGKIALKNLFSTKMMCMNTDAAERAYLGAINQVNSAKIENNELILSKDKETLLIFEKSN